VEPVNRYMGQLRVVKLTTGLCNTEGPHDAQSQLSTAVTPYEKSHCKWCAAGERPRRSLKVITN